VVPHYQMVGSKILWPDLGLSRIVNITPSSGDRPDRDDSATADIFRITLDPGAVITYIAELRTNKLPQIYLWEPDAYKDKINSFTLYHGIVIGIAGLLALFHNHPVRRQGQRDVFPQPPRWGGRCSSISASTSGSGQGVRHVGGRGTGVAGLGGGDPRRHPAGVPVRLSQSQPLACPLRPHRGGVAGLPRRAGRGRGGRSVDRLGRARLSLLFVAIAGFGLVIISPPRASTARSS
jgi:hypothetical protein